MSASSAASTWRTRPPNNPLRQHPFPIRPDPGPVRGLTGASLPPRLRPGADHSARNEYGGTPLHIAAFFGPTEAIAALLDAGADHNARDKEGQIPFDLIPEDSPVVGTSAYWRLNEARFD